MPAIACGSGACFALLSEQQSTMTFSNEVLRASGAFLGDK